jgi:ASC-1-like (ASCH) protein
MLCQDLGLAVVENGTPKVANPIYKEVLARQMTYGTQLAIQEPTFRWQKTDGSLDMDSLLREFQKFWRRHSEIWEQKSDYTEAFPHLLLMAFLQRITNGEGRIEREYAAGRGRMDLLVEYAGKINILEIKLIRDYDSLELVKEEGMEQIISYRDKFDKSIPCYLLIFDRRSEEKKLAWEQRITWEVKEGVTVLGC